MPAVISTLTDSVEYAKHSNAQDGGAREVVQSVTIKGGANLAQKGLVLLGEGPSHRTGIRTEVTEDELEFLKAHPLFQTHQQNGFIAIAANAKVNAEKVAADLNVDEGSAPITEADTKKGGRIAGAKLKGTKE